MSTHGTNTYHPSTYQSMPLSLDPPRKGQSEFSQESDQGQLSPPKEKQPDISRARVKPPKPRSPPPPQPTPSPPGERVESTGNFVMDSFKADACYSDRLIALAYSECSGYDEDRGGRSRK